MADGVGVSSNVAWQVAKAVSANGKPCGYRGTSLIRNVHVPRTSIGL